MTEIKGARLGDPPQSGPSKFRTFKPLELDESKFLKWVDIKNELNVTKIGVTTMGFASNEPSKILTF